MRSSPNGTMYLIILSTVIFLITAIFMIFYLVSSKNRQKKYTEEKKILAQVFQNELLRTQIEVQEQTLKTVAHNLHDNIGQLLSLITITLSTIDLKGRIDKIEPKIFLIEELTDRSIKELKALSRILHSEELLSKGLTSAIEYELDWIKKSNRFNINFDKSNFSSCQSDISKETMIFRLFQESINNILQHAKATTIHVILEKSKEFIVLIVRDDGEGFDVEKAIAKKAGMGLSNIKRRATMINGNAFIESVVSKGTQIRITIPCN